MEIPKAIIIPIIVILSIIGSYSINNNISDIYWMIAFGIFGYFLKMYKFPLAPMILGIILSQIIEQNLRRGIDLAHGNIGSFIGGIFTRPISFVLFMIVVITLVSKSKLWKKTLAKLNPKRVEGTEA